MVSRLLHGNEKWSSSQLVRLVFLCSVFIVAVTTLRLHNSQHVFRETMPIFDAPAAVNVTTEKTENANVSTTAIEKSMAKYQNETSVEAWRKKRVGKDIYDKWFVEKNGGGDLNPKNADSEGPILDFVIAGFPKCGTTAMMRILSSVTTMPPEQDVCTPISKTVYYSYINWGKKYGNGANKYTEEKPLRGSKCPRYIEGTDLDDIGRKLPRTKLVIGIRHPVLWYQSWVNMQWFHIRRKAKENLTLAEYVAERRLLPNKFDHRCLQRERYVCEARSRFYLSLARLGKTPLQKSEIDLLQSEILQSRFRGNDTSLNAMPYDFVINNEKLGLGIGVPNKVFVFDSSQGQNEYLYQELASYIEIERDRLPPLDNSTFRKGNGLNSLSKSKIAERDTKNKFDICSSQFDSVRKRLLPISYTLGQWLKNYFIPASRHRDDVVIPNVTDFESIIEKYGRDPCHDRLVRNETDGEYYLAETERPKNK